MNDDALLQRYRFGSRTADFLVCRGCGVYVGATIVAAMGDFGIANLRAVRALLEDLPEPVAMRYDGESPGARSARRARNWTPLAVTI